MATKRKQANKDAIIAAEIGAGVIAAGVAAAAGYYFYGTKDAKKHRAAAAKWARDMKADVAREARKAKKLDRKTVAAIVDTAAAAYAGARNVDSAQLREASKELKANWKQLEKELSESGTKAKKATKKSAAGVKKTAKKTAKKSG